MSSCDRQFPYSHLPLQTTENNFRHSVVHSNISAALCTTDSGSIRAGLVQGMSPTGCTTGRPPRSSGAGLPRRRTARLSPSAGTGGSYRPGTCRSRRPRSMVRRRRCHQLPAPPRFRRLPSHSRRIRVLGSPGSPLERGAGTKCGLWCRLPPWIQRLGTLVGFHILRSSPSQGPGSFSVSEP